MNLSKLVSMPSREPIHKKHTPVRPVINAAKRRDLQRSNARNAKRQGYVS